MSGSHRSGEGMLARRSVPLPFQRRHVQRVGQLIRTGEVTVSSSSVTVSVSALKWIQFSSRLYSLNSHLDYALSPNLSLSLTVSLSLSLYPSQSTTSPFIAKAGEYETALELYREAASLGSLIAELNAAHMLELQVTRTTDIFILSLCIAVWFQILTSLPSYWRNWMIFCVITVEYFSWNHIPLGLHVWESRGVQRSIGESGELRSAPISYQSQVSWAVSL